LHGNGNGHGPKKVAPVAHPPAQAPSPLLAGEPAPVDVAVAQRIRLARLKGYEGDPCDECGQLTMVRSGACLKCDTCGASSGCS
jgi:ribonucleoside-diphosphate reductase alpha chain